MKILFLVLLNLITFSPLFYQGESMESNDNAVYSPDKNIRINIYQDENRSAGFFITFNDRIILDSSKLGLVRDDEDFSKDLKLISVSDPEEINDKYYLLHGKKKDVTYNAIERVFHFANFNNKKLDIIFSISDDGAAFRYYFPETSEDVKTITKEATSYKFTEGTKTWIQPMAEAKTGWMRTNPSYEEDYEHEVDIRELKESKPGWVYPALFNSNEIWLAITETAPYRDYCGTRLIHNSGSLEFTIGFPPQLETMNEKVGANPNSKLPWSSPWRIVAMSDNLGTLINSTLGTDLAKPSVLEDISYVKPGRSSWSWVMLKDDSTIFPVQKRFIDYASEMGWEYCLIDAEWNKKIGYDSIKILADYAAEKNVGINLWYNSAGPWNDTPYGPRDVMLTKESREKEFARLKEIGIKGVKVDFFGGDGQDVMSYYLDIFESAAKYGIMVNTHGCTLPRGWHRTYPNLVTMESIRGEEFCTFTQEVADRQPAHCAVIPFTRNLFDPMDFTPVVFGEIPDKNRVTTNSFELTLAVLFLSGIQHYAETDIGMSKVPEYLKEYMKEIPVSWEETKFIDGYPGKLVVIARRTGSTWFIAGINGEEKEKKVSINLSFLNADEGELISDIDKRKTEIKSVKISGNKIIDIPMLPNGGFVMKFVE